MNYFVYIMASKWHNVLYIGVTSDLKRRVWEHKNHVRKGFTIKYFVERLVFYEVYQDVYEAIRREKQLKAGSRAKKIELVEGKNPSWIDLSDQLN